METTAKSSISKIRETSGVAVSGTSTTPFHTHASSEAEAKNEKCNDENAVIIRIWLPKIGLKVVSIEEALTRGGKVGHASIEIKGVYVSLWPENKVKHPIEIIPPSYSSLKDDLLAEDGPADFTVCLYSLDVNEMLECFREIEKSDDPYALSSGTVSRLKGGRNCASMVYDLLIVGGIAKLKAPEGVSMSSVVTPPELLKLLKIAKANEISAHPETTEFKVLPELDVEYIHPEAVAKGCIIS
jgi:hypothetical protein